MIQGRPTYFDSTQFGLGIQRYVTGTALGWIVFCEEKSENSPLFATTTLIVLGLCFVMGKPYDFKENCFRTIGLGLSTGYVYQNAGRLGASAIGVANPYTVVATGAVALASLGYLYCSSWNHLAAVRKPKGDVL